MIEILTDNILFGVITTLIVYFLSILLYRKTKIPLLNPVLVSLLAIVLILMVFDIPLDHYMKGGQWIIAFLPLTIILLALPLYRQLPLLLEHKYVILAGIGSGVLTSVISVFCLSKLLKVDTVLIRSLLPKSITTPLGLILTDSIGGIASITVLAIVITGLTGVLICVPLFKIFRISHPIAQGVALGTTSHAIGTAKAFEMGEIQGAMSGLSIVLAGIITVITVPLFLLFFF